VLLVGCDGATAYVQDTGFEAVQPILLAELRLAWASVTSWRWRSSPRRSPDDWRNWAEKCLRQVREYHNSPQDAEGSHLTAGRDRYIVFLQEAQQISGLDFSRAVDWLCQSMDTVLGVAAAIQ